MKKWLVLVIVVVAIGGLKLYQKKYLRTQEAVRQFFIYQSCNVGILGNFIVNDSLNNANRLYDQMSADFDKYGIQEWHLAHLGKLNNDKLVKYSNWVGDGIIAACGAQKYTLAQARDFVAVMLGIARTRHGK
jgi:hypothetical protein